MDSAILANSLHGILISFQLQVHFFDIILLDALQGLCFLVPRGRGRFLDRQYWLVVSCGLLVDAMGKWGISPETFFTSQNGNCNAQQGISLVIVAYRYYIFTYNRNWHGLTLDGILPQKCYRLQSYCLSTSTISSFIAGYRQVPSSIKCPINKLTYIAGMVFLVFGCQQIVCCSNPLAIFISYCISASTIDNSLKLTFNESVVPMNISLSDVKTKEAFAKLNETLVQVSLSNYRTASVVVGAWNTGESAATFSASVQCNPGIS